MLYSFRFLIIILLSQSLFSCCDSSDCAQYPNRGLHLQGFSESEMDSVLVYTYKNINGVNELLDSTLYRADFLYYHEDSVFDINMKYVFQVGYDFDFKIASSGTVYRVDGIKDELTKCYSCGSNSTYFEEVNEYQVNGVTRYGNHVVIYKD